MNISFDGFIRTTDAAHVNQVKKFVELLKEKDAVYLGQFEGWYDEGQEEYYTETKAKELDYKSPISGKDMVRSSEENYYFKLSAFQEQLEELHETNPNFLTRGAAERDDGAPEGRPERRAHQPHQLHLGRGHADEKHVIYVWIDALLNYITALSVWPRRTAKARPARATPRCAARRASSSSIGPRPCTSWRRRSRGSTR